MLLPEHEDLWPEAMAAILAHVGPGRYSYGKSTSIAPAHEGQIARLPGVTITSTSPYHIQAVDFGAFDDWDHYWTGLKGNIRRSLRRASEEYALDLQCQRGNAILGSLPAFALAIALQKQRRGALCATLADARAIAMTATGMGHSARLLRTTSGSDISRGSSTSPSDGTITMSPEPRDACSQALRDGSRSRRCSFSRRVLSSSTSLP